MTETQEKIRLKDRDPRKLASAIAKAALEKNAQNITVLDLTGLDSIMDYFIICTGEVNSQVRAITIHIEKEIRKELRDRALYREGYESLNWVLLDYVDVVVHVFRPSFRDYYRLEDLWSDAERVDITTEADLKLLTAPKKKPARARTRKTKTTTTASKSTE